MPIPALSRPVVLVGAGAVVVAAIVGSMAMRSAEAKPGEAEAIPVSVRPVTSVDRSATVTLSGDVVARQSADIGFQVPGLVKSVLVDEGARVKAGQALAELDPTDYQMNVDLAQSGLALAQDAAQRAERMAEAKAIPAADLLRAQQTAKQARTQADMAAKKLADTHLVAPIDGMVAWRKINPGEQVGPGMPVMGVVQMDQLEVRIGVAEKDIGRIRAGQKVDITIPSLSGAAFTGRVRLVGVSADPSSRTYTVKVDVANRQGLLRPGMIAEVSVEGEGRVKALTLPGESIVRDPDGVTRVFVYVPAEQRVYGHRVEVGEAYGTEIEIRTGLNGDEMVVVGGQNRVHEGSRVIAETETGTALAPAATVGDDEAR